MRKREGKTVCEMRDVRWFGLQNTTTINVRLDLNILRNHAKKCSSDDVASERDIFLVFFRDYTLYCDIASKKKKYCT